MIAALVSHRWALVAAALTLCAALSPTACRGGDADGDGDGDGDGDADLGGPLRVMTWNLENFPLSASTIDLAAAQIVALRADVVAIQEIEQVDAFTDLVQALPDSWDGVLNEDVPEAYLRVGLVWNTARVDLIGQRTLFRNDWYAFPRPPLMARMSVPEPDGEVGFDFVIVVVHQKARLDAESTERRRLGCERLEAWLDDELSSGGEQDYIVLGDWNDDVADNGDANVFTAFLDHPETYTFLTLELAEAREFTFLPYTSFLDHVLVTYDALDEYGPGGVTDVIELERTIEQYEHLVSDHRPVMVTFDF